MSEQMTKTKLIETLQAKRAGWDAALAEVPEDRMTELGIAGEWSVKDVVAHLAYYERWYADRLQEQLRGASYVPTELDRLPFDERNDLVFQRDRKRPLEEVLADSRQAFQQLLEAIEVHSEAFLTEPQQFEGAPGPVLVWQMLRGDVYEHYDQHVPSIKEWVAKGNVRTGSTRRQDGGSEFSSKT